ncbi:hypothetical protein [Oceanobacillus neutriphilus]|uniref:Uncharacterized protein n=1 Tax=Oceanobacillus neutriphilus TaxID=531815 RepID=A0ABQ2P1U7_9BACI|nr:hypothetical protein [Oceanobacillus neutriphilus]GGP15959.1 hypothetical protein GCM10011346_45870 [Oceanobacillus neutriphilus]
MKNAFISICTIMLFIPWTILILRTNDWALESPTAEIMILSYAAFMVFSGIFTIFTYLKIDKGALVKICLVINCLYAFIGAAAIFLIVAPS